MKNSLTQNISKVFLILTVTFVVLSYPSTINADSVGPSNPGTTADDATVGSATWSNPNNSQSSNNWYATATIADNGASHYLKATNFGFSIPTNSTINGILVGIERKMESSSNVVKDSAVKIVKADGTIGTTNKASTTQYPTTDTYVNYGSSSDLWGETWTVADINDADFGIVLSSYVSYTDVQPTTTTVYVDHIRITVYYTAGLPPTITSPTQTSITSSGATLGGNVTSDGGSAITGRGVCVGTSADPAIGGNCFSTSGTTGVFTVDATGLSGNTLYHYRAYATNVNGTSYTTDDTFTTLVAACTSSSTGDRFTLNESCSFSGALLDGIDANGTNSTNSAILTVVSGVTLTIPAQQTLATGIIDLKGSIVIIKNGKIKLKTPIYMTDSDDDNISASSSPIIVPNAADKRKYTITNPAVADCNDSLTNNQNTLSTTYYPDSDLDNYTATAVTGATDKCSTASTWDTATQSSVPGVASNNATFSAGARKASASSPSDSNDGQYCPLDDNPTGACNKCTNGAIAYQTSSEDLFSECAPETGVYLNSASGNTCNQVCATKTQLTGNCSGAGACGSGTPSCVSVGVDAGGTSGNARSWNSETGCYNTTGRTCSTNMVNATIICNGYKILWTNCKCQ